MTPGIDCWNGSFQICLLTRNQVLSSRSDLLFVGDGMPRSQQKNCCSQLVKELASKLKSSSNSNNILEFMFVSRDLITCSLSSQRFSYILMVAFVFFSF